MNPGAVFIGVQLFWSILLYWAWMPVDPLPSQVDDGPIWD